MLRLIVVVVVLSIVETIAKIPCPAPSPCRCGRKNQTFQYVYCSKQSWTKTPEFADSQAIYDELKLTSNSIKQLEINAFSKLKVHSIDLTSNPLENIHKRAFAPVSSYLRDIRLSGNPQTNPEFDCESLSRLPKLQSLYLSSFTIPANCDFPQSLRSLKLDKCVFLKSPQSLENVRSLSIEFSDIRHLQFPPSFPNLEHLSLRGNGLKSNYLAKLTAPSLKSLDLSINRFTNLLPLLQRLHSLQTLIAKDNELTASSVRSLFQKHCCLRNLTRLNLDRNLIDGSLEDLNLPSHLKHLSIRQNELSSIGNRILFIPPLLQSLDISSNPLSQTTTTSSDEETPVLLSYLTQLDLSSITSLPQSEINNLLEHTANRLETLVLAGMNLNQLPTGLKSLQRLKSLDVSNNNLSQLDNLPQNVRILLANNLSLSGHPHLPPSIQVLSLNGNSLSPFSPPPNLQTLFIDHYAHCDCSSLQLHKWLRTHPTKSLVLCEKPEDREFSELEIGDCGQDRSVFYEISLNRTDDRRFRIKWTSPVNVSRVTVRRLPLGPLISSRTLLDHDSAVEFADNLADSSTYQVCLIVRRRPANDRLVRLHKYCKNFEAPNTSKQYRFIAVVATTIYCLLGLLIILSISLLAWIYRRTARKRLHPPEGNGYGEGKYSGEITTSSTCFNCRYHECQATKCPHLYHQIDCRCNFAVAGKKQQNHQDSLSLNSTSWPLRNS